MDKRVSFSVKDMKWVIVSTVALILWVVTAILWVKSSVKKPVLYEIDDTQLEMEICFYYY